jgi:hypothetical protein
MKKILLCFCFFVFKMQAQVGINTTTPNAQLEIKSSDQANPANNDGILIPKVDAFPAINPTIDQDGMLVYLTTDVGANLKGFYYWDDATTTWIPISKDNKAWSINGNSGTSPATHFFGTIDNQDVIFKRFNNLAGQISPNNTSYGNVSFINNTTGINNTAIGAGSLYGNTIGIENTGLGVNALTFNSSGNFNTSSGAYSLNFNTTGSENTATGAYALHLNTIANYNAAFGVNALRFNTTGEENTAIGAYALMANTNGIYNTANGTSSLRNNTTGFFNVAIGRRALFNNISGFENIAIGVHALYDCINCSSNIALGINALKENLLGSGNIGVGSSALSNCKGSSNVSIGDQSSINIENGINNTIIGSASGNNFATDPSNFCAIGYYSGRVGSNSNTIEIGNTSVSWIGGQVGFFNYSDARIKKNVQENVPGLVFITQLRPVTYNFDLHKQNEIVYKGVEVGEWEGKYDIESQLQTGFIAQEVEAVAQRLGYQFNGVQPPKHEKDLYSVQYASFVVPLVKAVQEQQEIIERQNSKIQSLEERLKVLEEKLKE